MKRAIITAVVLLSTLTTAQAAPVQWSGNGHYYEAFVVPGGVSWSDAKVLAEQAGGYLATIHSEAENSFVFDLINNSVYWGEPEWNGGGSGPWLGGYQLEGADEPDGGWVWVTGESWTYDNWASGWGGVDLPDNAFDADKLHFIHVWSSHPSIPTPYWDDLQDVDSYTTRSYVVEYVPEPATLGLLAMGGLTLLKRKK